LKGKILAFVAGYAWPLALAAVLAAFIAGWQVRGWRCEASKLDTAEANAKASADMQDTADTAATGYEQDRSQTYADHTVREETIRTIYRDRQVPGDCDIHADARRVLAEAIDAANTRDSGKLGE